MPNTTINYLFALNLPPEKAIQYFQSKGYAFSWNWFDVWEEQHAQAFTVAKVMKLDLLMDIENIVNQFISGDMDYNLAVRNLEAKLRTKGWWGKQKQINPKTGEEEIVQLGSPRRIKTILETNMNVSLAAGREQTMLNQASFAPWWGYETQDDDRVRIKHNEVGEVFKGAVLRYDHPFWKKWYPPNDWGCRCFVKSYTEAQRKQLNLKILTDEDLASIGEPAEGWGHNPLSGFKPDLTKYPKKLVDGIGL